MDITLSENEVKQIEAVILESVLARGTESNIVSFKNGIIVHQE